MQHGADMHCEIYCNSHPPLSLIWLCQQRDKYWQRQRGDILSPVRCCGVDSECLLIKAGCGVMDGWNVIIAERQRCVEMEADGRRRNTFRREIKRPKRESEREREKIKEGKRWRGARRSQRPRRLWGRRRRRRRVELFGRLVDNTSPSSSLWSVVFPSPSLPLLPRSW